MVVLAMTALVLGVQHTLAPDHIAAVSVFASRHPSWRRALGLGARWGVGHSLTIVLIGGLLVWSGARVPVEWEMLVERVVGATLIFVGLAGIWRSGRPARRWHEHDGVRHAHAPEVGVAGHERDHRALLGIGMMHGAAGTGALVIAIPVGSGATPGTSMVFLASFGLGTILAMSIFAGAAGALLGRAARISPAAERTLRVAAAVGSIAVGAWWIVLAGG